jgi:signal transduction histidine kinase
MGRFLNANAIYNLSSSLNLLIELQPADTAVEPPDYQNAVANISDEAPFYIKPLNDDTIAAYAVINDIYGNPGLVARVETPREIYKIGSSSTRYYIFSFLLAGLIIGGINLLILEKTVLSRLSNLISSVNIIGRKNDLSQRLTVDGGDELSSLAAEINETLSSLERYHQMLQETEDKHRVNLESLVAERTGELQTANEQLLEERKRLYYLLENLPFIVCLISPAHSVVFANQYFVERFGSPEGKTCFGLYWNRTEPCEVCPAGRVIEKNMMATNECTITDGRTYQFFYYPFHDMDGSLLVLELGIDVTDHKQMEKEIAQLDRLNLVGEMAAGIGHEIRNPLTAVRGLLQLLGEKEDNAKYREYYDLMIEELDRSNSIISEFLSLAKNKPVQLKAHNLNQMVNTMLPLISADAAITDKCVETDLNDVSDLQLDEKEIRQLILNLVRNGMEEMPRGGKITIKTYENNGEVVLAIADQGKGINPDILKNIGTPFLTTKENGTGLGLAVCYSIAARHNAVIEVKTGPGGTTFYIKFKKQE